MEERIRNLELEILKLKVSTPFQEDSLKLYHYHINLGRGTNDVLFEFIPYDSNTPYLVNAHIVERERNYDQKPYGEASEYYEGRSVWRALPDGYEDRKFWIFSTQPGYIKIL